MSVSRLTSPPHGVGHAAPANLKSPTELGAPEVGHHLLLPEAPRPPLVETPG